MYDEELKYSIYGNIHLILIAYNDSYSLTHSLYEGIWEDFVPTCMFLVHLNYLNFYVMFALVYIEMSFIFR